jgi:hypothetical protein
MASLAKFFKKAAPLADDIAGAIVNYGDDVARLAANYGDDAARAVANYGDDALVMADKIDNFLPPASVPDLQAQQRLKNDLIYKRSPADHFDFIAPPAATSKASAEFVEGFNDPMTWGRFPRYTNTLGSVDSDLFDIGNGIKPKGSAVNVPEIPTSGLVVNRGQNDWRTRGFELRPHKNTAMGKWYDKNVVPVDSTRVNPDFFDGIDEVPIPIDYQDIDVDAPSLMRSDAYGVRSIDDWASRNSSDFDIYGNPIVSKGMFRSYSPYNEDSIHFPDGFGDPEDFARYYDSLELGYVPSEWVRDSQGIFENQRVMDGYDRLVHNAKPRSLPRVSKNVLPVKQSPNQIFSTPMFEDDWWL